MVFLSFSPVKTKYLSVTVFMYSSTRCSYTARARSARVRVRARARARVRARVCARARARVRARDFCQSVFL